MEIPEAWCKKFNKPIQKVSPEECKEECINLESQDDCEFLSYKLTKRLRQV